MGDFTQHELGWAEYLVLDYQHSYLSQKGYLKQEKLNSNILSQK